MDKRDLNNLADYFKKAPGALVPAIRQSLTHLAMRTKENDFRIISETMIVRNPRFVQSSLRFSPARGNRISSMEAKAFSVKRERFTGWEEQQEGKPPIKKRVSTLQGRGGNRRATMRGYARLRNNRQIYHPEQFQGRNMKAKFMFMMRVLNSRGRGEFLLTQSLPTRRGALGRGLYGIRGHKIFRYQVFDNNMRPRPSRWRTRSLQLLRTNHNMQSVWSRELNEWARRFR